MLSLSRLVGRRGGGWGGSLLMKVVMVGGLVGVGVAVAEPTAWAAETPGVDGLVSGVSSALPEVPSAPTTTAVPAEGVLPVSTGAVSTTVSGLGSTVVGAVGSVVGGVLAVPTVGATTAPVASAAGETVPENEPVPLTAKQHDPPLVVSPNTGLTNGESVTVSGTGYADNSEGGMTECNDTAGEPTMTVEGNAVPVGCTNPLSSLHETSSTGTFSTAFTVQTGTIGPPASGTDSAGNAGSSDSANYPCPPTAAQQAAGATCGIAYGDEAGDVGSASITFAGEASAPVTTTTTTPVKGTNASGTSSPTAGSGSGASGTGSGATLAAGTDNAGSADPSASGGSSGLAAVLPFTGFGNGLWWMVRLGSWSVLVGGGLLLLSRRRRTTRVAPTGG